MTLAHLLRTLGALGVELRAKGADLLHRPASLPPALAAAIRHHRAALRDLLERGADPLPLAGQNARYILGERLGIADDLGLPINPGATAWATALGEALAVEPPE